MPDPHFLLRPLRERPGYPGSSAQVTLKLYVQVERTEVNELTVRAALYGAGVRLEVQRAVREAALRNTVGTVEDQLALKISEQVAEVVRVMLAGRAK